MKRIAPLCIALVSHQMYQGLSATLLSIGSAAGMALMGTARGVYTFGAHLKWMPVVALGYAASIFTHIFVNNRFF